MRRLPRTIYSPLAIGTIIAVGVASSATRLEAQEKDLKWGPAPAVFPAGAKMAVERGDPTKEGEFVVHLSFPAGYKIAPHFHPTDEHITVLSGDFLVGMGDKLDAAGTHAMAKGDSASMPAGVHHFAIARGATTVKVRAEGPFVMTYVNPADMPKHP